MTFRYKMTLKPIERRCIIAIYEEPGLPIYKVGYRADISYATIFKIIDRLLEKDLIYIKSLKKSSKNIFPTDKAKELIKWKKI